MDDDTQTLPRSVVRIQHHAQISHRNVATAAEILAALKAPTSPASLRTIALPIQEADLPEIIYLMVDGVLNGAGVRRMLADLAAAKLIRRPDLMEWSERFA